MMDAVHRYEGTVNQVMGDGIMALFGAPVAHEDHAVRVLHAVAVRSAAKFDSAFSAIVQERAGAVLVLSTPLFMGGAKRLAELAIMHKLPTMFGPREHGAKPAQMPVEQATKFELVINLKAAKALGLTIPPSLLLRADQVIE